MEARIIELETLVAFQERTIAELSDLLYAQNLELDALKERVRRIEEHVRDLDSPHRPPLEDEGPPPHY